MARSRPVMDRLKAMTRVDASGCVIFTGHLDRYGYGRISYQGRSREAYRVAYEQTVGPVPAGLELDHLCRVRACVNTDHLEPVTPTVNKQRSHSFGGARGGSGRQDECPRGHAFTPENTGYQKNGTARYCRECRRISNRANQARSRQMKKEQAR